MNELQVGNCIKPLAILAFLILFGVGVCEDMAIRSSQLEVSNHASNSA